MLGAAAGLYVGLHHLLHGGLRGGGLDRDGGDAALLRPRQTLPLRRGLQLDLQFLLCPQLQVRAQIVRVNNVKS